MEYDRTPATKALRRAERKIKMKEYRKANRKANRHTRKEAQREKERLEYIKRRELEKKEFYKTPKGQKQYYIDNLEAQINYYNDIVNLFKKAVKSVASSLPNSPLSVFAQNYNFMRIMSGMPSLAFSNNSSISSNMSQDEIRLSRLNTELEQARKKVYDTVTGKHKTALNKEIRVNMIYKTMNIPYELGAIIDDYRGVPKLSPSGG